MSMDETARQYYERMIKDPRLDSTERTRLKILILESWCPYCNGLVADHTFVKLKEHNDLLDMREIWKQAK